MIAAETAAESSEKQQRGTTLVPVRGTPQERVSQNGKRTVQGRVLLAAPGAPGAPTVNVQGRRTDDGGRGRTCGVCAWRNIAEMRRRDGERPSVPSRHGFYGPGLGPYQDPALGP